MTPTRIGLILDRTIDSWFLWQYDKLVNYVIQVQKSLLT